MKRSRLTLRVISLKTVALLLLCTSIGKTAAGEIITHTYTGSINWISNLNWPEYDLGNSIFSTGDDALFSYSLDNSLSDWDPEPNAGWYPGAIESVSFYHPDSNFGFEFSGTTFVDGFVSVFDNTSNPDDQFLINARNSISASPLEGLSITEVYLDFIGSTNMISGDSIPTSAIVDPIIQNGFGTNVTIFTDQGSLQINLTATPVPEPATTALLIASAALIFAYKRRKA